MTAGDQRLDDGRNRGCTTVLLAANGEHNIPNAVE